MDKKKRKPFDRFSPEDEDWFKIPFSHLFEEIKKEQEELFRELEKEQEELRRLPAKPSKDEYRTGIFFSISSDGIHPPRIEMGRLGPKGWEPIREEIHGLSPIKETEKHVKLFGKPKEKPAAMVEPGITYEEAPYTYNMDINQVTIELKVSDVEKEENIELQFYPESLEMRAVVPKTKKRYFAVLKVPTQIDRENTEVKIEKDKVVIRIPRKHTMVHEV